MLAAHRRYIKTIMREFCGTVKYSGVVFDIHWDTETKIVYVSKSNSKFPLDLMYKNFTAESKDDAKIVAKDILKKTFGDELE